MNVIVTRRGLIFMLIAAALVTASFLISPVIENIYCKYCLRSYVSKARTVKPIFLGDLELRTRTGTFKRHSFGRAKVRSFLAAPFVHEPNSYE